MNISHKNILKKKSLLESFQVLVIGVLMSLAIVMHGGKISMIYGGLNFIQIELKNIVVSALLDRFSFTYRPFNTN